MGVNTDGRYRYRTNTDTDGSTEGSQYRFRFGDGDGDGDGGRWERLRVTLIAWARNQLRCKLFVILVLLIL